jgi:hypothetical protein
MGHISGHPDHGGGGQKGEDLEGSLTDGGNIPGHPEQPRHFGAGRAREGAEPHGAEDAGDPSSSEAQAGPADPKPGGGAPTPAPGPRTGGD